MTRVECFSRMLEFEMPQVTFIDAHGESRTVEGEAGATVMEVAIRNGVPGATAASLAQSVTTLSAIFGECSARYTDLAGKADRHANDAVGGDRHRAVPMDHAVRRAHGDPEITREMHPGRMLLAVHGCESECRLAVAGETDVSGIGVYGRRFHVGETGFSRRTLVGDQLDANRQLGLVNLR